MHRWQLESLIDTLGPFALGFGLDEWLAGLDGKQTGVLFASDRWEWIQARMKDEILTRGLGQTTREHWTERCPHSPLCQNGSACEVLSICAAARKARGQ